MTTAANCFLKYVWWTACYSAWSGIPKLAEQWKAAGSRASFYGWSLLVLELASVLVISGFIRVRSAGFFRKGLRFAVSLTSTVAGTALFAWILSLVKQGIR